MGGGGMVSGEGLSREIGERDGGRGGGGGRGGYLKANSDAKSHGVDSKPRRLSGGKKKEEKKKIGTVKVKNAKYKLDRAGGKGRGGGRAGGGGTERERGKGEGVEGGEHGTSG